MDSLTIWVIDVHAEFLIFSELKFADDYSILKLHFCSRDGCMVRAFGSANLQNAFLNDRLGNHFVFSNLGRFLSSTIVRPPVLCIERFVEVAGEDEVGFGDRFFECLGLGGLKRDAG